MIIGRDSIPSNWIFKRFKTSMIGLKRATIRSSHSQLVRNYQMQVLWITTFVQLTNFKKNLPCCWMQISIRPLKLKLKESCKKLIKHWGVINQNLIIFKKILTPLLISKLFRDNNTLGLWMTRTNNKFRISSSFRERLMTLQILIQRQWLTF